MCNETTKEQLYNEYDSIIQTIATNIMIERERSGNYIISNFNPQYDSHKLFFNVTAVLADLNHEKIYLDMSLLDYLKFRIKRSKKRSNLRWFGSFKKKKLKDRDLVDTSKLMLFIATSLNINVDLFRKINNEYYGWVD